MGGHEITALLRMREEQLFGDTQRFANLAQAQANIEQAKHPSIFVSGSRPAIMWVCCFGLAWQYVIQPIALWSLAVAGSDVVLPILPTEGLMTLTLSLLGLGGLRSAEKWKGVARENMSGTK